MRKFMFALLALSTLGSIIPVLGHAQAHAVELHAVAADGRLGPAVTAPLQLATVDVHDAAIDVVLAPPSAQQVADATAQHLGTPLAIVADGHELARMTVRARIDDGHLQLTTHTPAQAQALAHLLEGR